MLQRLWQGVQGAPGGPGGGPAGSRSPHCFNGGLKTATADLETKGYKPLLRDLPDNSFRACSHYGLHGRELAKQGDGLGWELGWERDEDGSLETDWLEISRGQTVEMQMAVISRCYLGRGHPVSCDRSKVQMARLAPGQACHDADIVDDVEIQIVDPGEVRRPVTGEPNSYKVFLFQRPLRGNSIRIVLEQPKRFCALKLGLYEKVTTIKHPSRFDCEKPTYKPLRDYVKDFECRKQCSQYLPQDSVPAFRDMQPGSERWLQKLCEEAARVTQSNLQARLKVRFG